MTKNDLGYGKRSWRYALVIKDGKVEKAFVEKPGPTDDCPTDPFEECNAEKVLDYVKKSKKK